MRGSTHSFSPHIFIFPDCLVILIALVAALCSADSIAPPANLSAILDTRLTISNILRAAAVFAVWSLSMHLLGIYREKISGVFSQSIRIALAVGLASVTLAATFGQQHKGASPRHIAADFALFCFLVLFGIRGVAAFLSGSAWRRLVAKRSVLIIGSGPLAIRAYKELRTRQYRSHSVLGFVDCHASSLTPGEIESLYLGPLSNLETILLQKVVDEVIVSLPARSCYAEIEQTIEICSRIGIEVKYPNDLFEISGRAHIAARSRQPEMIVIKPSQENSRFWIKRLIDISLAAVALICLSPLFLFIAAAIKLTSAGSVFFLQERYGQGRRRFRICKFRTMVTGAEDSLPAIESLNGVHGPVVKFRHDPRVTPVGRLLRRTSLDELPQLFNVLTGHMSLVGPRPMTVRDVSRFGEAWLMRRFSVKPGMTCLWQVNGRGHTNLDRCVELDLHYIDNWSLGLDARILALTIPAVVRGNVAT